MFINFEAFGFFGSLAGVLEVYSVIVELLLIKAVDEAKEEATDKSSGYSDADGGKSTSNLQSSLPEWSADESAVVREISCSDGVGISSCAIVEGSSDNSTQDSSDKRWDSVNAKNSTGVIEANFVLKVRAEVLLGKG